MHVKQSTFKGRGIQRICRIHYWISVRTSSPQSDWASIPVTSGRTGGNLYSVMGSLTWRRQKKIMYVWMYGLICHSLSLVDFILLIHFRLIIIGQILNACSKKLFGKHCQSTIDETHLISNAYLSELSQNIAASTACKLKRVTRNSKEGVLVKSARHSNRREIVWM